MFLLHQMGHVSHNIEERTLASEIADVERKAIVLALESNC